jgi:hypothetical protein
MGKWLAFCTLASNSFHKKRIATKSPRVGWAFRLELPARLRPAGMQRSDQLE